MTISEIIVALGLPDSARVDQRVPKKLLLENGAPTPTDKRRIGDGIEEFVWVAALKPTTIGVPEYRDEVRDYLEIAILRLSLRTGASAGRLIELVHRAVPYPILLLTEQASRSGVSAAHKRWSKNERGKTVLDGDVFAANSSMALDTNLWPVFCDALALNRQPRSTLYVLYQGWVDTLCALNAALWTGIFSMPSTPERAAARRDALKECGRLETEIVHLRTAAENETQVPRQVEFNLEIKKREAALEKIKGSLN